MRRLKRLSKPRTKKKEVVLTLKLVFEAFNDNEDEAKTDCKRFKEWVKNEFSKWNDSVLQYFLYAYKLQQDDEDSKFILSMNIDKILKDESATLEEIKNFMENLESEDEEQEEELQDLEEEYIEEIDEHINDEHKKNEEL